MNALFRVNLHTESIEQLNSDPSIDLWICRSIQRRQCIKRHACVAEPEGVTTVKKRYMSYIRVVVPEDDIMSRQQRRKY